MDNCQNFKNCQKKVNLGNYGGIEGVMSSSSRKMTCSKACEVYLALKKVSNDENALFKEVKKMVNFDIKNFDKNSRKKVKTTSMGVL